MKLDSIYPVKINICGLDELPTIKSDLSKKTYILSFLDPDRMKPHIFSFYQSHKITILRFHDIIEQDSYLQVPTQENIQSILSFGKQLNKIILKKEKIELLIHCHMGISRSTAAMIILIAQANPDLSEDTLFDYIRNIRPICWPNSLMIEYADKLLNRNNRLLKALYCHYRLQLKKDPTFEDWLIDLNRNKEVQLGKDT